MNFKAHKGKQTQFLQSRADWIFFGGARGGSKSFSLAWKAALSPVSWHYEHLGERVNKTEAKLLKSDKKHIKIVYDKISIDFPDYVALLIRRTFPQLERNLKPECAKLYKSYGAKWQERNHCFMFPSGAKVYLVHCKDRKALDNYIGGNYHFLGIDEANQFPEDWVQELSTSVRSSNRRIKPQICLTSNPGNIGHVWLKRNFVDRCTPIPVGPRHYNKEFDVHYQPMKTAEPYIDEEGISYQYIPATVFDNPALLKNDKKYVRELKKLNPTLRAMWLEGRWDVFQGMYFDKWDDGVHVMDEEEFVWKKDFDNKTHEIYRGYDYGTKEPFVCLFIAVDKKGNMVVFDEIVEKGLPASAQAELVKRISFERYGMVSDDFAGDIADPAYQTRHSEKEGMLYSPKMFYADAGIYLTMGNNDRKAGAKVVYDGLSIPSGGVPRIRFTSNCEYCCETIPSLPSKINDPEDVDTDGEDHAYDSLRYPAMKLLSGMVDTPSDKKGWREKMLEGSTGYGNYNWMSA